MWWQTRRFRIDLTRPQVMGIVNVTPDSFSDGGQHASARAAMAHCEQLLREGADLLDIGGESTRPGAQTPSVAEELARVLPVVRHAVTLGVPISVDTSRAEVITAVLEAGADIINDVRALQCPGSLAAVTAHAGIGVCLMHMQGDPQAMQQAPHYDDVVAEVRQFLAQRLAQAVQAGVPEACIALDPGYGFGKTAAHNLALLQGQAALSGLGRPVLIGWSRKRTLGEITGKPVHERVSASVAAALAGITRGARIVRVHDVAATVDAVKVWAAAGLVG